MVHAHRGRGRRKEKGCKKGKKTSRTAPKNIGSTEGEKGGGGMIGWGKNLETMGLKGWRTYETKEKNAKGFERVKL